MWSTFIGGDVADQINDICLDDSANIYMAGKTSSTDFPVTNGILQNLLGGEDDMFIAKFDSTGSRKWASYFGGSEDDAGIGIIVDKKRNSYLVGNTLSDDLSLIGKSFQDTFSGGFTDLAIAKFSPSGKGKWSSYFGGSNRDEASSIATLGEALLITGSTLSSDLPTSKRAFQTTKSSDYDGFFLNLDTAGDRISSSFIGGNNSDFITDGIFYNGAQAFTGYSRSTDYYSKNPEQSSNAGVNDVVLTTLCPGLFKNRIVPIGAACFDTTTDSIKGYAYEKEMGAIYKWQVLKNGNWSDIPSSNNPFLVPGSLSKRTSYRRIVFLGLCSDTSQRVTLIPGSIPTAIFNLPSTQCRNDSVTFDNLSTLSKGTFASTWFFGDGDSSQTFEPTYKYKNSGRYTVTLKVTSDSGCVSTAEKDIYINASPKTGFTIDQVCTNDSITLTDNTKSKVDYTLQWDLGDGNTETKQGSFSYLYAVKGTYTIQLIASTDSACTDTIDQSVTIDSLPKASFVAGNGCINDVIDFDNTSSPSTGSTTYDWDLGNGTTQNTRETSPTYTNTGTYMVRLIVKTNRGCADTTQQEIAIVPKPTEPNITHTTYCNGDPILFEASGLNRNKLYRYEWSMGNNDTIKDTTKFTYAYSDFGQYNVNLRIYVDSSQCAVNKGITVLNDSLLKAQFSSERLCDGDPTFFTDESESSSGNLSWKWFFGDGNTSTDKNPKHQYSLGTFTVKMVISSDLGCSDSITKQFEIQKNTKGRLRF